MARDSSINVRVFPDDRPAIALWVAVPIEWVAVNPISNSLA